MDFGPHRCLGLKNSSSARSSLHLASVHAAEVEPRAWPFVSAPSSRANSFPWQSVSFCASFLPRFTSNFS